MPRGKAMRACQRRKPALLKPFPEVLGLVRIGAIKADTGDELAIDRRNDVAHRGWAPGERVKTDVAALLRVTAAFIDGPRFRFPRQTSSNLRT